MERIKEKFQLEDLLLEAFRSNNFLIINKTLIKQFGLIPAILLSNYIDKYVYFKEKKLTDDSWFYLTHQQQMEELNLKEHLVRRTKQDLIEKKIIECEFRGSPPKEWFKINFVTLVSYLGLNLRDSEVLNLQDSKGLNLQDSKGYTYIYINKNKYNISSAEKSHNKRPSRKELSKQFIPLAQYLYDVIRSNRNIQFKPSQIESWAYNICQLIETNGIEPKRIRAALRWYKNHIGEPYVPVIASGGALKDKFLNLEAAMARHNNPAPKSVGVCPNGWKFGSCNEERQGCINCEQDSYKLFLQCKAYRKYLSNT